MKSKLEQESSRLRMRAARWCEISFSQKYRFGLGQSFIVMDQIVRSRQMAERQSVKRSEICHYHNDQMDRMEQQLMELRQLIRESKVSRPEIG